MNNKSIVLSQKDFGILIKETENPRKPSDKLVKAAEEYNQQVKNSINEQQL